MLFLAGANTGWSCKRRLQPFFAFFIIVLKLVLVLVLDFALADKSGSGSTAIDRTNRLISTCRLENVEDEFEDEDEDD